MHMDGKLSREGGEKGILCSQCWQLRAREVDGIEDFLSRRLCASVVLCNRSLERKERGWVFGGGVGLGVMEHLMCPR